MFKEPDTGNPGYSCGLIAIEETGNDKGAKKPLYCLTIERL
jgi:hypothetical protein